MSNDGRTKSVLVEEGERIKRVEIFPAEENSVNRRRRQWVGELVPTHMHAHAHNIHTHNGRLLPRAYAS